MKVYRGRDRNYYYNTGSSSMTTLNTEGAVAHTSSLLLQHRNDLNPTVGYIPRFQARTKEFLRDESSRTKEFLEDESSRTKEFLSSRCARPNKGTAEQRDGRTKGQPNKGTAEQRDGRTKGQVLITLPSPPTLMRC